MSRSPRPSLRLAVNALTEAVDVASQHSEAAAELQRMVGDDALNELSGLRDRVQRVLDRLEAGPSSSPDQV